MVIFINVVSGFILDSCVWDISLGVVVSGIRIVLIIILVVLINLVVVFVVEYWFLKILLKMLLRYFR